MSHPPIPDGAVLIGSDGRIAAVGPAGDVPHAPGVPTEDFGDAVIMPGLINTHTHLELTGFSGLTDDLDFPGWLRRLRQRKAERSTDEFLVAARQGVLDCFGAGVTTVADTGDSGVVARALTEAGGSGMVYHEVFGPDPDQRDESLAALQETTRALQANAGPRVRIGVSPHAPYTVSGPLYAAVAGWAISQRLSIAVHVAESADEDALLDGGAGAFADAWRRRGITPPPGPGRSPIEWLDRHGVLGSATLCIHAIRVGPTDIGRLGATGTAVAHCPLSNRAHGHGDAPLRALLDAGVPVGVGTDSVASVGRLDLLAEARAAREIADLNSGTALGLCTVSAARALRLHAEIGALSPGLWGDCAVVDMHEDPGADPEEWALASRPSQIRATFIGGTDVYRADRATVPI